VWGGLSAAERRHQVRWYGRKYGLTEDETRKLLDTGRSWEIEGELDRWRDAHGLPATNSPLSRGKLLSLIRGGR